MSNALISRPPTSALAVFPDNDRYKCRYQVASETSDRVYMISFDMAQEAWCCSCRGCIAHGQCKHLTAADLYGRKFGRNHRQAQQFLSGDTRKSVIPSLPEIQKIIGKEKKEKALPMLPEVKSAVCKVLRMKEAPKVAALPAPACDDGLLE